MKALFTGARKVNSAKLNFRFTEFSEVASGHVSHHTNPVT
jgi:hypothetical protein